MALEAEEERKQKELKESSMGMKKQTTKKVGFVTSSTMRMDEKKRMVPILSDEHEQTQKFSSKTGASFTEKKKLDKEQAFFLSNNKGIALVFSPVNGDLPSNSEVPVSVTIYNNVCGKFDDTIVASVNGLPEVKFPVRVNISGSPIVIPPNQVGLNYNTIPANLPMPTIVANTNSIQKSFKIKNTGMKALDVNWKIFDQSDLEKQNSDYFDIGIIKNTSFDKAQTPFKFNFTALEPSESTDTAYEVVPKQASVAPRSSQEFTVYFHPNKGVGLFQSTLLASPQVSEQEIAAATDPSDLPAPGSLGIIALSLNATTISPYLQLDKNVKMDGEKHVKFTQWAVVDKDVQTKALKKLVFSNDTKADMTFHFQVDGPFSIVKSKSNTGAKHPLALT